MLNIHVPKPDPESQQAFDRLTTKVRHFSTTLALMDAAMCSRLHLWKLIRKAELKDKKILNHPFEVIIPGAEDTEGIAIQRKEAARKHFLKIFRAKGPSVRNYLSNKVDSLKPPWR
jgi:hypothetical protein